MSTIYADYYTSAKSLKISRERALKELKRHGIEDTLLFDREVGIRNEYDAQEVLNWLGY